MSAEDATTKKLHLFLEKEKQQFLENLKYETTLHFVSGNSDGELRGWNKLSNSFNPEVQIAVSDALTEWHDIARVCAQKLFANLDSLYNCDTNNNVGFQENCAATALSNDVFDERQDNRIANAIKSSVKPSTLVADSSFEFPFASCLSSVLSSPLSLKPPRPVVGRSSSPCFSEEMKVKTTAINSFEKPWSFGETGVFEPPRNVQCYGWSGMAAAPFSPLFLPRSIPSIVAPGLWPQMNSTIRSQPEQLATLLQQFNFAQTGSGSALNIPLKNHNPSNLPDELRLMLVDAYTFVGRSTTVLGQILFKSLSDTVLSHSGHNGAGGWANAPTGWIVIVGPHGTAVHLCSCMSHRHFRRHLTPSDSSSVPGQQLPVRSVVLVKAELGKCDQAATVDLQNYQSKISNICLEVLEMSQAEPKTPENIKMVQTRLLDRIRQSLGSAIGAHWFCVLAPQNSHSEDECFIGFDKLKYDSHVKCRVNIVKFGVKLLLWSDA